MIFLPNWQNIYKRAAAAVLFTICMYTMQAQELNCTVKVTAPQIQGVDPSVITSLQKAIYDLMNNTKWTNDNFSTLERIDCTINITITSTAAGSNTDFMAQASIVSSRPVYNSSYKSTILNMLDQNWEIEYQAGIPVQYVQNGNNTNVVSMLAYYAYIILGLDYDTYSLKGGTQYFQKANDIVTLCQNNTEAGWSPFKSNRNRYWLVNNILDPKFDDMRKAYYTYHLKGLDKMYANPDTARANMLQALTVLDKVYSDNPFSYFMQQFFAAKADEITGSFSAADAEDKTTVYTLATHMDASNAGKYAPLQKN